MKVFALTLYQAETLSWDGVDGWHLQGGYLYLRFRGGATESVPLERKYIGVYDDDPTPAISRHATPAIVLARRAVDDEHRAKRADQTSGKRHR